MEGAATASNEETKPTLIQPQTKPKCPRCGSSNTKFCYYNNYSLSQPRFFCKSCRRYWTHGGTLRNVPIGGGTRKPKRPKTIPSSSPSSASQLHPSPETLNAPPSAAVDTGGPLLGSSSYSRAGYLSSLETIHSTLNESSVVADVVDYSFGLSQQNWTHPSFGHDDHNPTWTTITNSISSSSAGNNENSSLETENDCCNLVPNHHGHDHDHDHLPPYARLP